MIVGLLYPSEVIWSEFEEFELWACKTSLLCTIEVPHGEIHRPKAETQLFGDHFLEGMSIFKIRPILCFENQKKKVLNPAPSLSPSLSQKQASFCPQTWNPSASCASSSRMVPQVVTSTPSHWDSLESRGHTMLPSCSYRSSCSRNSENKRPDCRPEYSLLAGPSV